jgi:uncharacterized protein (TIGR03435 family)
MKLRLAILLVTVLSPGSTAWTQSNDGGLVFEAVSVKPAGPVVPGEMGAMQGGPGTSSPGRILLSRATLSDLLCRAYDVWPDQIAGPQWIDDRIAYGYRIEARLPPDTTTAQLQAMLQNLLAERFHLKIHRETRSIPGFELLVAGGGPKLKQWIPGADPGPARLGADGTGFAKLPPGASMGLALPKRGGAGGGATPLRISHRESMALFCQNLATYINISNGMPVTGPRPRVIDKTGLTGTYEFTLEFAGSLRAPGSVVFGQPPEEPGAASSPSGVPDLFAALEKQLGLKLVKVRDVPVNMVVVDSADRDPTPN